MGQTPIEDELSRGDEDKKNRKERQGRLKWGKDEGGRRQSSSERRVR